jgi:aminopeptidase N
MKKNVSRSAASVIRMIEQIMTPAVFQKGLNSYLEERWVEFAKTHKRFLMKFFFLRKFLAATDEQLFAVLEAFRNNASYPPIPDIFRSWARTPGYPILNVNYSRDEKVIKISQEQFAPLINETESSAFFILYNYVESQRATPEYWMVEDSKWEWINNSTKEREHTNVADSKWVIFNLQQTGMIASRVCLSVGK